MHLLRVQGFCFAMLQYSSIQAFTAAFLPSMHLYSQITKTVYRALQGLFLGFVPFYRRKYQTDTSGYNTACATLERLPAPGRLAPIQDTTVTPGRYTGQHSRPIIIRYIRVRPCSGSMPDSAAYRRPCQPGGVSMLSPPGISLALCFLPGTAARNH